MFQRRTRRSRAAGRRRPLSVEALERRELLSLSLFKSDGPTVVEDLQDLVLAEDDPPLTNTAVTEAQISALIPNPPTPAVPVRNVVAHGVLDNASPIRGGDCDGHVQSAAFDLGGGKFLYAYQLECHCLPNWDVGYAAAGGGLRVTLNGNIPLAMDFNNDGIAAETSFHTTNVGFRPFRLDLTAMNDGDDFTNSSGDFTTAANQTATYIEFLNANGIFLTGDVAGFITNAPPTVAEGTHLGGSRTVFRLVVPSPQPRIVLDFDGHVLRRQHLMDGGWSAADIAQVRFPRNGTLHIPSFGGSQSAIDEIVRRVREDYSLYKVDVVITNSGTDPTSFLTDSVPGDIVLFVGGTSFIGDNYGVTVLDDPADGNQDGIGFVFTQTIERDFGSSRRGVAHRRPVPSDLSNNVIAQTISHEAGHSFGLRHVLPASESETVIATEIMASPRHQIDIRFLGFSFCFDLDKKRRIDLRVWGGDSSFHVRAYVREADRQGGCLDPSGAKQSSDEILSHVLGRVS